MSISIVEKGQTLDLNIVSKQTVSPVYYFGGGWDLKDGKGVDLDLVAVMHREGKSFNQETDLVYFANKNASGVSLSEDNRSGGSDVDDENIIIKASDIPSDVSRISIGVAAYQGATLESVDDAYFRVCDGDKPLFSNVEAMNEHTNMKKEFADNEIGRVKICKAGSNETALHAFDLVRVSSGGFSLEVVEKFAAVGMGGDAIKGVAKLAVGS